ncbi:hypothetical protein [Candidatus Nitrospira allomarina]|uniref:Lipoprotein n=1 Tax=Candidatus Nitrospira allomarina TaxID=3020900 RepID=A0AA96GL63_9BACT|nr:hypothetical protein [Candidatus Nitrospira allomarina]WNM59576.1 hypothetical protein PP769_07410 [Candidatus Nitrospira allomarina]
MTLSTILFTWVLVSMLAGCGAGPTPRLIDLVGKDAFASQELSHKKGEWPRVPTIGLVVHADATARNAAPVIIAEYLETLTRRTEDFLRQRCSFQNILTVPRLSQPLNFSQELKVHGQHLHVPYEIVVVFSSREKTSPVKIGEATMMNQMGGMVIENSAIAEVGVLRLSDLQMVYWTQGWAFETLEQLDVPIGKNRPSAMEARDILRARAGQQALDRALHHVGAECEPAV